MLFLNKKNDCAAPRHYCDARARWSLLGFAAAALLIASPALAADWLAPAADQTVTATWVKDVTNKLGEEPYRNVLASSMGEPPHSAIVRYLNNAAQAIEAGNKPLAESYVDMTLDIFDRGVRRGYYLRSDVEPIKKMIRTAADAAMKGEKVAAIVEEEERWQGYTEHKKLGLVNEEGNRMELPHRTN